MSTTVAAGRTFALRGTLAVGQALTAESGAPGDPLGAFITVRTSAFNEGTIDLLGGPPRKGLDGATGATLRVTGVLTNSALINAYGGSDAVGARGAVGGSAIEIASTGSILSTGAITLGGAVASYQDHHDGRTTGAVLRDNGALTNNGVLLISGSYVPGKDAGASVDVAGLLTNAGYVEISSSPAGYHGGNGGILRVLSTGTVSNSGTITVGPGGGGVYNVNGVGVLQIAGLLTNDGTLDLSPSRGFFGDAVVKSAVAIITNTGTVTNTGVIGVTAGEYRTGRYGYGGFAESTLTNGGVLTNIGTIDVGGRLSDSGLLTNSGLLVVSGQDHPYGRIDAYGFLNVTGSLSNSGSLQVGAGSGYGYRGAYFSSGQGGRLLDGGVVSNSGTIQLQGAYNGRSYQANTGGTLSVTGILVNTGLIDAAHGTDFFYSYGGAMVQVAGLLTNFDTIYVAGLVSGFKGGAATLSISASGQLLDPGLIAGAGTVDNAGVLSSGTVGVSTGTIAPTLINSGIISVAASGALAIGGAVLGYGQISIAAGGVLTLNNVVSSGQEVDFAGTYSTLALGDPSAFYATIEGLLPLTTIDFLNTAVTSATSSGTDLVLSLAFGGTLDLTLAAPLASYATLSLTSDLRGGTDLSVINTNGADPASGVGVSAANLPSSLPTAAHHFQLFYAPLLNRPL